MINFTFDIIIKVRETWNLIKEDKIEKGSKIFIRIFEKRPEIKVHRCIIFIVPYIILYICMYTN